MLCRLTDRLPINRDAALITFIMHPTKQVHAEKFIIKHLNLYTPCLTYPAGNRQLVPKGSLREAPG